METDAPAAGASSACHADPGALCCAAMRYPRFLLPVTHALALRAALPFAAAACGAACPRHGAAPTSSSSGRGGPRRGSTWDGFWAFAVGMG